MTYQIQIALKESKPKIWRRILVSSDTLLPDLHKIIQVTMGWTNAHLHHFEKDRTFYLQYSKDDEFWVEMDNVDYSKIRISKLLKNEKDKMIYEYDFGDGWKHDVILEEILEDDKKTTLPICLTGKNKCPPENCGGVWGYADILEMLKNRIQIMKNFRTYRIGWGMILILPSSI